MVKCDFCDKSAVDFGSHGSYRACDVHISDGLKVEQNMFEEFEQVCFDIQFSIHSPEFLRET